MPNLAGGLIDLYFEQHYKRGSVLRFYMECDDPNVDFKYKFGILLNLNTAEPEAFLAITTSNLKAYASGFLENDIVRVPGGKYRCFPKQETIINLREIRIEAVSRLRTLCEQKQMTFEGALDASDMIEVDAKLVASRLIERQLKKRIVPLP
jgi:hypothetical protein